MGCSCSSANDDPPGWAERETGFAVCADRLMLNGNSGITTALEPYVAGDANAARCIVKLWAGTALFNGTAYLQGTNDGGNYTILGSVALNGIGVYSISVSGIAFAALRLVFVIVSNLSGGTYSAYADMSLAKL
jgi:hypothetical protein